MNHFVPVLGDDLWSLVCTVGTELVSVEPVTRLPALNSVRASFRLTFADGRVLKGRRIESEKRCETLAALAPALTEFRCSRVVAQRGAALLEEWIPGVPLEATEVTPGNLEEAGELLGFLSRFPVPAGLFPSPRETPEWFIGKIEQQFAGLVGEEKLTPESAGRLLKLARIHQPEELHNGLVHRDYCAENLVVTPDGTLFVIDNENIRIGALDGDLARTSYRWPMTPQQWRVFSDGYERYRDTRSFMAHEVFWSIVTLSGSAWFRVRRGLPHSVPLVRLRDIGRLRFGETRRNA